MAQARTNAGRCGVHTRLLSSGADWLGQLVPGGGVMTEESLFAAALERGTTAERHAFLAEAAAGDDALRRRVELLLAADGHAGGPLDGDPGRGPPPDLPPPAEGPGDCVGRYKLKEQ